jgi:hypothetical protein
MPCIDVNVRFLLLPAEQTRQAEQAQQPPGKSLSSRSTVLYCVLVVSPVVSSTVLVLTTEVSASFWAKAAAGVSATNAAATNIFAFAGIRITSSCFGPASSLQAARANLRRASVFRPSEPPRAA